MTTKTKKCSVEVPNRKQPYWDRSSSRFLRSLERGEYKI